MRHFLLLPNKRIIFIVNSHILKRKFKMLCKLNFVIKKRTIKIILLQ